MEMVIGMDAGLIASFKKHIRGEVVMPSDDNYIACERCTTPILTNIRE